jgi:hypothetical protein
MDLKVSHAKDLLNYLFYTADEFNIVCKTEDISFNPELPKHISSAFGEIILFVLANYTLENARIEGENLIFETGFGEENFPSVVTVPIASILQMIYADAPIFVNPAAALPKPKKEKPKNPFELNPRNKKFMRE